MKKLSILLFCLLLLALIAKPVYAAPRFLTLDEVNSLISSATTPLSASISNLEQQIQNILSRLTNTETETEQLSQKVDSLKQQDEPYDFVFFNTPIGASSAVTSEIVDVKNHNQATLSYSCTHPSDQLDLHLQVSQDQTTWNVQKIIDCDQGSVYTFDVAGRYYRIMARNYWDGGAININVFGHFTREAASPLPPVEEIMVFDYGDLNGSMEPKVINLAGHRVFTINCLVDSGDGGTKTWSSNDQVNWNLEYRDGCGGKGPIYNQNTAKVKANYYKVVLEGAFKGYVSILAN